MPPLRFVATLALLVALALTAMPGSQAQSAAPDETGHGGVTGLPVPRFVSLRSDEVNMRTGPGIRYPIDWVYQRRGLPVEVIDEFEAWRRIRDREGTTGWVHQSMLSAERTAVITGERRMLRQTAAQQSEPVAWLEPGVIVTLERCDEAWCEAVALDGNDRYRGWLGKDEIWGVYPEETL
ncbi:MAG TPA: SH3 domain-containing protein [Kiloniellales bacterium]|nr:SH3 domain-containing protein [Kiloniellales bacterium]